MHAPFLNKNNKYNHYLRIKEWLDGQLWKLFQDSRIYQPVYKWQKREMLVGKKSKKSIDSCKQKNQKIFLLEISLESISELLNMTQYLSFLTFQKKAKNYSKISSQKVQQFIKSLSLPATISDNTVYFFTPVSELLQNSKPFYKDYAAIGVVQVSEKSFDIYLCLKDCRGRQIRATAGHQRIALPKFCMILNSKLSVFQVKTHPIDGSIRFSSQYLFSENSDLISEFSHIFNSLKHQLPIFIQIIDLLELTPENYNTYLQNLISKLDVLQGLQGEGKLCQCRESTEQKTHQQYFPINKIVTKAHNMANSINVIERMKLIYVESFSQLFIMNSKRVRSSNFNYWKLDPNPDTEYLLKIIRDPNPEELNKRKNKKFVLSVQGKEVEVQVKHISKEDKIEEYSISENISRKNFYLPFVKQYVLASNMMILKDHFIITKKNSGCYVPLDQFLIKNRANLSLETKIRLISHILCMGYVCGQKLPGFVPSCHISNILVGTNLSLRLDAISRSKENSFSQIFECILKIMFNKTTFFKKPATYFPTVFCMEGKKVRELGPSPLIKFLLKIICELGEGDKEYSGFTQQDITVLEKVLLASASISDLLQKQFYQTPI